MFDPDELEEIRANKAEWHEAAVEPVLDRFGERKETFTTDTGGQEVDRLYTPDDVGDLDYEADLGNPGEPPYTRGVYSTGYRGRSGRCASTPGSRRPKTPTSATTTCSTRDRPDSRWRSTCHRWGTTRTLHGRRRGGESRGGDRLACRHGDRLRRHSVGRGLDLDDDQRPRVGAAGDVHRGGGPAGRRPLGASRDDSERYPEGVYRAQHLHLPAGTVDADHHGHLRLLCLRDAEVQHHLDIGYHIREAGSTAAQELAFTLGNGIEYVETAIEAGLDVDEFAPQLSFFFNGHNNIFEEVAKFRAARRMWHDIIEERFDPDDPKSKQLKFHTQTAGSMLTAQQIENNVVRVAYQALAAVLGGTQSLHTNGKDEALALPTEESVRTALRTQQILAHESGAADTIDPLAGSYYVESLTDDVEEEAYEIMDEVDDRGGMLEAVEQQWVQRQIQDTAFDRQREIEEKERIIVGVNEFEVDEDPEMDVEEVTEADQQRKIDSLEETREERDDEAVDAALEALRDAARSDRNLMPYIIDAVKAYATVGEICNVMRDEFGEYQPGGAM